MYHPGTYSSISQGRFRVAGEYRTQRIVGDGPNDERRITPKKGVVHLVHTILFHYFPCSFSMGYDDVCVKLLHTSYAAHSSFSSFFPRILLMSGQR